MYPADCPGDGFDASFDGDAFVAFRGSWQPDVPSVGFKVRAPVGSRAPFGDCGGVRSLPQPR